MTLSEIKVKSVNARLADETPYQVPYWEVRTGRPGAHVLVTAEMHGNEFQGSEVLRRFVSESVGRLLRGSCALVPFANPVALQRHVPHMDFDLGRYYGSDKENNLNCTWPGDRKGTSAQRLSHALFQSLVSEATHNIDLHCWAAAATTALVRGNNDASVALARASAFRFVRASTPQPEVRKGPVFPCTLSSYFNDTGRAALVVEFDGQYCVREREVQRGLRAMRNGFRYLELLDGEMEGGDEKQLWLGEAEEIQVEAPCSGLFVQAEDLVTSDLVPEGRLLGHFLRDDNLETIEVRAPASGYLYALGRKDPARKGEEFQMCYYHPYVAQGTVVAILVK
jgi:predicted deacylase